MERYARAIEERAAPQPDLGATLVGPEPSTTPIDASSVAPNGENEPDGVVILEAITDVPVRPARRSEADDEIVFIE